MERYQRTQQPKKPEADDLWTVLVRFIVSIEEAVARVLNDITSRPQLDTVLLESLALTAGFQNKVQHKLGRVPRGWKLVDVNAAAIVSRASWDSSFLVLNTSANCTVSLEVF
jgi:hypothetical protein